MPQHHFKEGGYNYGAYQGEIYKRGLGGVRPTLTTDSRKWEEEARKRLPRDAFGYVAGGAGERTTMDSNRAAFRKWSLLPRMLQGNTHRDLSVELFGRKYPNPVLMAPVGTWTRCSLR